MNFTKPLNDQSNSLMKMRLSKSHKLDKYSWKVFPLSNDQKPEREDER